MSAEAQQQFCLRWHNYQNSLLSTLPQLLDGDDLTDVTLCASGRSIKAHKIVLSACSQYFKEIFRELQPMQHPVIVLPGTEFTDLCALVTFMYSGEVNIYQQQLPSLLTIADTLQIRGLAEFSSTDSCRRDGNQGEGSGRKRHKLDSGFPNSTNSMGGGSRPGSQESMSEPAEAPTIAVSNPYRSMYVRKPPRQSTARIKCEWLGGSGTGGGGGSGGTGEAVGSVTNWWGEEAEDLSRRVKEETPPTPPTDLSQVDTGTPKSAPHQPSSTATHVSSGNTTSTNTSSGAGKGCATCFICGKQLSNAYNLRVHLETHQNAHYACSSCNHVSRSRDALRKHVSYRHPVTVTSPLPPPPDSPKAKDNNNSTTT